MDNKHVPKGEGFGVMCPSCGQVYHETTELFSGDRAATGKMFKLRAEWGPAGENWLSFPDDDSYCGPALECPGCGASYTEGERVLTVPLDPWSLVEVTEVTEATQTESIEAMEAMVQSVVEMTAPQPVAPKGTRSEIKGFKKSGRG